MRTFESIALGIPEVLLPREGIDPTKWAVIACDQYTSEPEYWAKTAAVVGDAPSTLNLIYPEVFLHEPEADKAARIARIRETMARYLAQGLFRTEEGIVYVERKTGGHIRRGLVVALDLEAYDYRKGATTLIRATEGTILDRIPPRVRIRDGAPLETPHIMVLIDDPADTVIGPLAAAKDRMPRLYDFELMLGSGRLAGYRVADPAVEAGIVRSLSALADPRAFAAKLRPAGRHARPALRHGRRQPLPGHGQDDLGDDQGEGRRQDRRHGLAASLRHGRAGQPPRPGPGLRAHPPGGLRHRARAATWRPRPRPTSTAAPNTFRCAASTS